MTTATVAIIPVREGVFRATVRLFNSDGSCIRQSETGEYGFPIKAFEAALNVAEKRFGLDCSNYRKPPEGIASLAGKSTKTPQ